MTQIATFGRLATWVVVAIMRKWVDLDKGFCIWVYLGQLKSHKRVDLGLLIFIMGQNGPVL
ncbi:hypothetical protein HanIR_Chr13g0653891 [Helianthus annuus]|nr:hypothetical protein HanIR_Chr13g0653891 [Helianthus annuus]